MENNDLKKSVLEVKDLVIHFNVQNVNTNIGSFVIKEGDFVLLKGRNGSGKSTFLRLVNLNFDGNKAYCSVLNGDVSYIKKNGQKIVSTSREATKTDFEELRKNIVEVRQDENFASFLTPYMALTNSSKLAIERNEELTEEEKKEKLQKLDQLVKDIFNGYSLINGDTFSLKKILSNCSEREFTRKKLKAFSGGQQKMIQVLAGFVKAKITEANLMLLDEPANNLDGKNKYYLNQLFKEIMQTKKTAMLMISHCHVFDDITTIIDIDYAPNGGFTSKLIQKDANNTLLFSPHHDCIEDCENKLKEIKNSFEGKI